ncbi:MAG: protoporphyrinogen oxidase [Elusimicrobia bacterium HGW-Elusimicrobia-4]|nr:MAG: protoporphyrinogen oxidase [Elusimicrobia bacterium HGW-Elusimicrobia-4]
MKTNIVIIGGGITGLSVAYHLKNEKYVLLEKEHSVGGLCKSVTDKNGFTYDYTGHLLHIKSRYVKKLVKKLLKKNLTLKNRNSWIYSNNVFTRYPFQANLFGLPEKIIYECIEGFIKSKLQNSQLSTLNSQLSFHDWCLKTFGNGISKYFMFPYNEKLWKIDIKKLTCDWLGNYVPQPTLQEVIKGAFTDDNKKIGYNATFFYPKMGGIQSLIDALKKNIPKIKTDVKISSIDISKKIVKTNNGNIQYKNLVNTIPLPEIVKLIKSVPENVKKASKKLKWTSVLNINLGIKRKNISDKHWIYFPEKKFNFYRAGFYRNFSESLCPDGTSSMYIEISYPPDSRRAGRNRKISKEKMLKKTIGELKSAGVLKSSDKIISECILDIPYAYVIYDKNRKSSLETIRNYLRKNFIFSIGRFGGWQYSTMEDAILEGKEITKWLK